MSYIKYIEGTKSAFPDQPPYEWSRFDSAPWTPIEKELSKSRIVLISSGGVYRRDQEPFKPDKNDLTFREIPKDVNFEELRISHDFYDHTDADKDKNCVFPLERLRELEKEGFIGELSEVHFTFMGRIFKRTQLQSDMIPHLVQRLKELSIDLAFLVPA